MQTNDLREQFLAFFESKGCVRKPSDVLVPKWDPSVLFTPAGMNQFKDHFLGRVKLASPDALTKATTCQKCLRTGDIDNVGRTAYHHTFFEMLGNFSFGDYFKKEAIHWAWEFLTHKKWLAIEPAKLSVTVYKDDHEAAKIWLEEIGIPEKRLQYLDEDENFWPASAPSLGPDGVCGPCSEIYHDTPSGPVEIWNLVFTQFNRVGDPPNNLQPLPSKNIDTGMGLERCAAVLQGVDTNYHIDILRPLVEAAGEVLGVKYEPITGGLTPPAHADNARRLRRIADHIRACAFAVHENVYPGNKEEKYVIRRLLRRAVLDGRQMGHRDTFLHLLIPKVAELMKEPYPELSETTQRVAKVIETEEEHFISTLDSGLDKIERIFSEMHRADGTSREADQGRNRQVAGHDIFDMYQTFGFPPELFETMATERGFAFDWEGFRKEMAHHGEISGSAEKGALFKEDVLAEIKQKHKTEFVGYDATECEAKIIAIVADGKLVDSVPKGQTVKIVLDRTSFYGEKGGQVGDKGCLQSLLRQLNDNAFAVEHAQIDGDLVLHVGNFGNGSLKVGDTVLASVCNDTRQAIARAHTATHLLHYVLRKTLGEHAEQQGSKVDADILRFDFTNHQAVNRETLQTIETEVNQLIIRYAEIESCEQTVEDARKAGAIMLFGEKYPEMVRVIQAGESKELCGGTHVGNTSQIGLFKIISEESVAAGVRRITALTGNKAVERVLTDSHTLQQLASLLKIPADEILAKVENLNAQVKQMKKQLAASSATRSTSQGGAANADALIASAEIINGIKLIACELSDMDVNSIRQLIDQIRQKADSVLMLFAVNAEGKVMLLSGASRDITDRYSALDLIRRVAPLVGGKGGGGRPDFAQSGGSDASKLAEVFADAKKYLG
ncbi:MAG: alanine--tRNA ligase [Planctomycetaceae bacterium]|nr:alanine--tRNA ligase [Planctomycetaceae bacterium]